MVRGTPARAVSARSLHREILLRAELGGPLAGGPRVLVGRSVVRSST